jgi:hypothetical protein
MKHKFKIEIGDPSKDGHNQSEDRVIVSNKIKEQVREAYNKSCLLTGLVFTGNKDIIVNDKKLNWRDDDYSKRQICTEYESYKMSKLAEDILQTYGIKYTQIDGNVNSLVNIFLEFIKLSLPDFEYDIVENEIPSLGLTIGYGLFE